MGGIIACEARHLLGGNWSLSVQRKHDHELIQSGIYRVIIDPIYTGLLLLFFGNVIIVGDYRAIIAVRIVFASSWLNLRKEERLLVQTFGDACRECRDRSFELFPYVL